MSWLWRCCWLWRPWLVTLPDWLRRSCWPWQHCKLCPSCRLWSDSDDLTDFDLWRFCWRWRRWLLHLLWRLWSPSRLWRLDWLIRTLLALTTLTYLTAFDALADRNDLGDFGHLNNFEWIAGLEEITCVDTLKPKLSIRSTMLLCNFIAEALRSADLACSVSAWMSKHADRANCATDSAKHCHCRGTGWTLD